MHAFQTRTVDTMIGAMKANHPHLTTQKSSHLEISRACDRAELVTDDSASLRQHLEATSAERTAALEADRVKRREAEPDAARDRDPSIDQAAHRELTARPEVEKARAPRSVDRGLGL